MATTKDEEKKFLLVFGSETGQAKAIAEIIRDKALERGLLPDTLCFSQYDKGVWDAYMYLYTLIPAVLIIHTECFIWYSIISVLVDTAPSNDDY